MIIIYWICVRPCKWLASHNSAEDNKKLGCILAVLVVLTGASALIAAHIESQVFLLLSFVPMFFVGLVTYMSAYHDKHPASNWSKWLDTH